MNCVATVSFKMSFKIEYFIAIYIVILCPKSSILIDSPFITQWYAPITCIGTIRPLEGALHPSFKICNFFK